MVEILSTVHTLKPYFRVWRRVKRTVFDLFLWANFYTININRRN